VVNAKWKLYVHPGNRLYRHSRYTLYYCDNCNPSACATATLHVVVDPATVILTPYVNDGIINIPIPGNVGTNDNVPAGTTYGTPVPGLPAGQQ